jgi:hypothetical protein
MKGEIMKKFIRNVRITVWAVFETIRKRLGYSISQFNLPDMLTILFIMLKLTGHIDWSWWWVVSPTLTWEVFLLIIYILREEK